MFSHRARRNEGRLHFGSCIGGDGSKMTKCCQPPLAHYSPCLFGARAKQPANPAFVRREWAERIREVGFLRVAVAVRDQLVLIVPGCFTAKEYRIRLGTEVLLPALLPNLASRSTERPLISFP